VIGPIERIAITNAEGRLAARDAAQQSTAVQHNAYQLLGALETEREILEHESVPGSVVGI
jgi:hypothetical protein